ncbi:MAG: acyltransferase [Bacteroidales bacterium]|nr:acyltransferase [Bacteroidales bacterium]
MKQRIEYIDALRGFTIILVVMYHVSITYFGAHFDSPELIHTYNYYFLQFRMPLFFFVAGLVFFKPMDYWTKENRTLFFKKKFKVQLLSPFIFFVLYCYTFHLSVTKGLMQWNKEGYWFTYVLMIFFSFWFLFTSIINKLKVKDKTKDILLIIVALAIYCASLEQRKTVIVSILSLVEWNFFLFFVLGAMVRKYYSQFTSLILEKKFITLAVALFFLFNIFSSPITRTFSHILFPLVTSLAGVTLVFALFYKNRDFFKKDDTLSNSLKFIGKRTLDIYLIHYFFLQTQLPDFFNFFNDCHVPLVEFCCTFIVAIVIIAFSLAISSVIRLSNPLASFLFGVKKEKG